MVNIMSKTSNPSTRPPPSECLSDITSTLDEEEEEELTAVGTVTLPACGDSRERGPHSTTLGSHSKDDGTTE